MFRVRPGITATARYASNGQIAELLISPETPDLIKSRKNTLSQGTLKEIIDELVPPSERGKFLIGAFVNLDCLPQNDCTGSEEEYERIVIYYNAGSGGVNYAVVRWREWMDVAGATAR
jgi:hypothetical protein